MGFSLSGGLSAMGGAISKTAGIAALEIQRNNLEKDKLALAEALAEGRETRGREQAAEINKEAAGREMEFRAGESLLNRGHEAALTGIREKGENERLAIREKGETARNAATNSRLSANEAAAQKRFDAEMKLRIDAAKKEAKDREEKRILDSAIAASTTTEEQEYTTADGERATRPVKVFNPEKAAGILRDTGHENLAAPLFPKKVKSQVTGKPSNRPPLGSFLNGGD